MGRAVSPLVNNQDAAGPTGPREPAAQEQGCRVLAALEGTDGLTDPARQYHDNQHQENDPTKTTTDCRPTKVKTASAKQQQKHDQQNDYVHSALLSDLGDSIVLDDEP